MRPMNSISPSACHRPRSPVRYSRPPVRGWVMNRSAVFSSRPRYPIASPMPPMCSSPGTPTGQRYPSSSRICHGWFAMAWPYGTDVQCLGICDGTANQIDQIDASVAPPKLTTWTPGESAMIRVGMLTGIQSPESITRRSTGRRSVSDVVSSRSCISAGAEFHTVTRSARRKGSHVAGLRVSAALG